MERSEGRSPRGVNLVRLTQPGSRGIAKFISIAVVVACVCVVWCVCATMRLMYPCLDDSEPH